MPKDAENNLTDQIIGRSLVSAETLASALRERIADELGVGFDGYDYDGMLRVAGEILEEFEPLLAENIHATNLVAWLGGYEDTAKGVPRATLRDFLEIGQPPPPSSVVLPLFAGDDDERLRFPIIERGAESLLKRNILTRPDFDQADAGAQQKAFTVAGDITVQTIGAIRDTIAEDMAEGTAFTGFKERIKGTLDGSFLGPAHIENVYRTNVQSAFRDGREALADHPIVDQVFPYQEHLPIHDGRVTLWHLALGSMGLDGTGVYRRDDPFWDYFTAPLFYNCRCGTNLLTIKRAAEKGVREAQEWLASGEPPQLPEYRLEAVLAADIKPNPGWGHRQGVMAMSLLRMASEFKEEDHPRDDGGQFAEKEGGGTSEGPKQKQTKTPAFKKWFGDSKVVDEDGEPLVVYHGTTADFDTFDGKHYIPGWFGDRDRAEGYAKDNEGASVKPVFLSIVNPLRVPFDLNEEGDTYDWLEEMGLLVHYDDDIPSYSQLGLHVVNSKAFVDAARSAGFDGIIANEAGDETIAVFDPKQIKSATGNKGTFDPSDPRITMSIGKA